MLLTRNIFVERMPLWNVLVLFKFIPLECCCASGAPAYKFVISMNSKALPIRLRIHTQVSVEQFSRLRIETGRDHFES